MATHRIKISPRTKLIEEALCVIPKHKRPELIEMAMYFFLESVRGRDICKVMGIVLPSLPQLPEPKHRVPRARTPRTALAEQVPVQEQQVQRSLPGVADALGLDYVRLPSTPATVPLPVTAQALAAAAEPVDERELIHNPDAVEYGITLDASVFDM